MPIETPAPDGSGPSPLVAVADRLRTDYGDAIDIVRHEDNTDMTPMLSMTVDGGRTRAAALRDIFAFEQHNPVVVTGVHRHRIVVRAE